MSTDPVAVAAEKARRAVAERDKAIIEATVAGRSARDIGQAAGLSHTGVIKIIGRHNI